MRVLMTGSRYWDNETAMREAFRKWWREVSPERPILVAGGARGADSMAERIWRGAGLEVEVHRADWGSNPKAAGLIRNAEMVNSGVDICFAFYKEGQKNAGTGHCAGLAEKSGVEVRRVYG